MSDTRAPESVSYDPVAPGYDRRYHENSYTGIESLLDAFTEPRHAALEVGCGTGHWVARLAARGCRVAGLDPSAGMLGRAAGHVGSAMLVRGHAEALPFMSRAFDRVVVVNALHHFRDPARFAIEAHRVLCPGGRIVVVGLDPSQGPRDWFVYEYFERTRELDAARYPTTATITAWLEAAGFRRSSSGIGHRIDMTVSARDYLDRGALTKDSTSQLSLLSEAEYTAGIRRIRLAIEEAAGRGETLELRADLDLHATFASVPA
jgi:ubiquinone/menaquinone biosynthesis C-methylase UbiE